MMYLSNARNPLGVMVSLVPFEIAIAAKRRRHHRWHKVGEANLIYECGAANLIRTSQRIMKKSFRHSASRS